MAKAKKNKPQKSKRKSKSTRLARLKKMVSLLAIAMMCYAGFLVVGLGLKNAWEIAQESGVFNLQEIEIHGLETVTRKEVLAYGKLRMGTPLYRIDVGLARLQIRTHPWVKDAEVRKDWPSRLVIDVEEQVAQAMVRLDRLYYVNEEGIPFISIQQIPTEKMVLIEGIRPGDFKKIEKGQSIVKNALGVVRFYRQNAISSFYELKTLRLHDGGYEFVVGADKTKLVTGHGNLADALARAKKVLRYLEKKERKVQVIHLDNRDYPNRVSVRAETHEGGMQRKLPAIQGKE